MSTDTLMTCPALGGTRHGLILRHPEMAVGVDREEALNLLLPWHQDQVLGLGYELSALRTAEQVHGDGIAIATASGPSFAPEVDGLVTNDPDVLLGIYIAECCAVYLHDPKTGALGLVHSGRKGSELGIARQAVEKMHRAFGASPGDIIVQLSPCIRPPSYEVDFAAGIRVQCLESGIRPEHLHDCGICTSTDLQRFYSYRVEMGKTGRMLALLGRVHG